MNPVVAHTAAAVVIGNELLSGKIAESNLFELARTLRALGVRLERALVLPDEVDVIATEVRWLSRHSDVVFTSGGIGPTHDDVTIEAVARAFDVPVESDPVTLALILNTYGDRCNDGHRRMALIPRGAELATTPDVQWPTVVMKNVWLLPGVPEIFRMKLSVARAWIRGPQQFVSRAVFTNMDEADLKPLLEQVVRSHHGVEVGSYPKWFDPHYKTKVTFDARESEHVDQALERFLTLLPSGEPQRVE
jgi:molybdenum cofactor synthesis domain-containing protein